MSILAKAPDFVWDADDTEENNVCYLLEYMGEVEDNWGDPVYDYYSMAHWVIKFLDASRRQEWNAVLDCEDDLND